MVRAEPMNNHTVGIPEMKGVTFCRLGLSSCIWL